MRRLRRIKILATLGPASSDSAMIRKLFEAGADVFRINMSHTPHDKMRELVKTIRNVESSYGRPIGILVDLQGPKLRLGQFEGGAVQLNNGQSFTLDSDKSPGNKTRVHLPHPEILAALRPGHALLLDDGKVRLIAEETSPEHAVTRVVVGGKMSDRKGVSLPDTTLPVSALTEKDRSDLDAALNAGVDWIAVSFVQRPEDVAEVKKVARGRAAVMAKIEKPQAVARLAEIMDLADALMVARGDLGIECPFEELPVIQRRAVRNCLARGRPVIVATHMLESMITQPVPTRAEITDVANAVYEQADCVMLSGETTVGHYPLECVRMLDAIARRIEREASEDWCEPSHFTGERMKVLHAAVVLARQIPGARLVTFTRHGFMAHGLALLRPTDAPIHAFTPSLPVFRQLRLLRAVDPLLMELSSDPNDTITHALALLQQTGRAAVGDKVVIATDIIAQDRLVDSVQLRTIR